MLSSYLAELSKIKLLSEEEEKELWHSYKVNHNVESRAKIVESYQPLVYKIVSKIKTDENLAMDLLQEGTVGLIEAVENFDLSLNIKFTTYAPFRIRGRVINYLEKISQESASKDDSIPSDDLIHLTAKQEKFIPFLIEKKIEDDFLISMVLKSINKLSEKEKKVIIDVFIEDKKPLDLAREMGISVSYLSRLQKRGIKRLRGMLSKLMKEIKSI